MKISELINDEKNDTKNINTLLFIKDEIFKSGIYEQDELFFKLIKKCKFWFDEFKFFYNQEKPDVYPTFIHAACEWFDEKYTIAILKELSYQERKNNKTFEEILMMAIKYQKKELVNYLENSGLINNEEMIDSLILKNHDREVMKKLGLDFVISRWENFLLEIQNKKRPDYDFYDLSHSMWEASVVWSEIPFLEKIQISKKILPILAPMRKYLDNENCYGMTLLARYGFINIADGYEVKNNGISMTLYEYMEQHDKSSLESAMCYKAQYQSHQLEQLLEKKTMHHQVKI